MKSGTKQHQGSMRRAGGGGALSSNCVMVLEPLTAQLGSVPVRPDRPVKATTEKLPCKTVQHFVVSTSTL